MKFARRTGVIRLKERYGTSRLEAACRRALAFNDPCYRTVKTILENGLDQQLDIPEVDSIPGPERYDTTGGTNAWFQTDATEKYAVTLVRGLRVASPSINFPRGGGPAPLVRIHVSKKVRAILLSFVLAKP